VSWPLGSRLLHLPQSETGRERAEQSETEEQGQQTAATELGFDGGGSGELADGLGTLAAGRVRLRTVSTVA